jgi:hypothetical protein
MIIYGRSRLAGTSTATCDKCDFMSVYWESEEDLEHNCHEDIDAENSFGYIGQAFSKTE